MLLRGARCENVKLVMEAARKIYESLEFTEQAATACVSILDEQKRLRVGAGNGAPNNPSCLGGKRT
jgi:hypothetical protein